MTAVQIRNDDGTTTAGDATVRPAVTPMEALTTELAVSAGGQRRLTLLLTSEQSAHIGGELTWMRDSSETTPFDRVPDRLDVMTGLVAEGQWKPSPEETKRLLNALAGLSNALEGVG